MKGFLNQTIEVNYGIEVPVKTPCVINGLTKEDSFDGGIAANVTFEKDEILDQETDLTVNIFVNAVSSDDPEFQTTINEFKESEAKVIIC